MPIYEYRCSSCGVRKEHLQKISDPKLTVCPECGKETYEKQLTAAGFQLKGSGWYVTDFRNGASPSSAAKSGDSKDASKDAAKDGTPKDAGATGSEPAAKPAADPAGSTSSASSTPAPASSTPASGS